MNGSRRPSTQGLNDHALVHVLDGVVFDDDIPNRTFHMNGSIVVQLVAAKHVPSRERELTNPNVRNLSAQTADGGGFEPPLRIPALFWGPHGIFYSR